MFAAITVVNQIETVLAQHTEVVPVGITVLDVDGTN
jgi:hypothetical protein